LSTVLASGRSVMYGAFDPELGALGGGSHNPRGDVTEIVGVGVLPAHRRRGIAGHLTWALAADAAASGVRTVFMSAGSDDVARIYEGVGFRRVGTACIVG
jgi:predicted GNAT family acetyltransferase